MVLHISQRTPSFGTSGGVTGGVTGSGTGVTGHLHGLAGRLEASLRISGSGAGGSSTSRASGGGGVGSVHSKAGALSNIRR